jgi:hypothetical protein
LSALLVDKKPLTNACTAAAASASDGYENTRFLVNEFVIIDTYFLFDANFAFASITTIACAPKFFFQKTSF